MADNWFQIKAECAAKDVDRVSAVMSMISNSLMIEDNSDIDSLIMNGVYGDLIDESLLNADRTRAAVSVFVPGSFSPAETIDSLKTRLADAGIEAEVSSNLVKEEDWSESWKQYYKPIHTGKKIVIVPVWEKYEKEEGEIEVLMDPGMAFGTGTHETTRLCASLLEEYVKSGDRMIDVGCGSGILAICASKLGADYCFACDIDPVAVEIAEKNTILNNTPNVECRVSDLLAAVDNNIGLFDIAAVNIVADVIIRLAPQIGRYLKKDATLIVSGIILERAEEVIKVLNDNGFEVFDDRKENGWYCAALRFA